MSKASKLRIREQALEQAKRVPWRRIAAIVDEVNEWEEFSLWVRAVVDGAGAIPELVRHELETRIPGFLARVQGEKHGPTARSAPGHRLWNLIGSWMDSTILFEPKTEGWLDAVTFFSTMSLSYMKAWAHWESVNEKWRTERLQNGRPICDGGVMSPQSPDYRTLTAKLRRFSMP